LRHLSRERPVTKNDLKVFRDELIKGSDMATALIGSAFVDNQLRDLLLTYMRKDCPDIQERMFDNLTAPLSSFIIASVPHAVLASTSGATLAGERSVGGSVHHKNATVPSWMVTPTGHSSHQCCKTILGWWV
jgi:hypothetical protein